MIMYVCAGSSHSLPFQRYVICCVLSPSNAEITLPAAMPAGVVGGIGSEGSSGSLMSSSTRYIVSVTGSTCTALAWNGISTTPNPLAFMSSA